MSRILIAGLDIATTCGGAVGYADAKPRAFTWRLAEAGKSRPDRLARLRDYCDRFFGERPIDGLFYELPLPVAALFAQVQKFGVQAAFRMGATDETISFLRGAIGIVEASASKAGIQRIEGLDVQEARRHLLGPGHIPKGQGKKLVFERCQMLGWKVANNDEADAAAIFALGCGIMKPALAHLSSPLFAQR